MNYTTFLKPSFTLILLFLPLFFGIFKLDFLLNFFIPIPFILRKTKNSKVTNLFSNPKVLAKIFFSKFLLFTFYLIITLSLYTLGLTVIGCIINTNCDF